MSAVGHVPIYATAPLEPTSRARSPIDRESHASEHRHPRDHVEPRHDGVAELPTAVVATVDDRRLGGFQCDHAPR